MRKVTLELVYEVVEERSGELKEAIDKLSERQDMDFRYLNDKIDRVAAELRGEIGQLRQEIGQLRQEMDRLDGKIDRVNQRIDTLIQMLSELMRKS
ncbi:hypothetical protein [Hydrogenivirga sp.]